MVTLQGTDTKPYKFHDEDSDQDYTVILSVRDIVFFKLLEKLIQAQRK